MKRPNPSLLLFALTAFGAPAAISAVPMPSVAGSSLSIAVGTAGHYRSYRHHRHFYPRLYFSYGYHRPYPYYGYAGYPYGSYRTSDMGAVDLGVRPKSADVYLDGRYVGRADNFDGYPRFLWLHRGDHQLVFYKKGYRTEVREISIQPGVVVDLRWRMQEGEAEAPETFFETEEFEQEPEEAKGPGTRAPRTIDPAPPRSDFREAPARLRLRLSPIDAVVYLDGRLLGSGEDLRRLHAPLVIDPGAHVLEVVRPGYETEEIDFVAEPNEEISLQAELKVRPGSSV